MSFPRYPAYRESGVGRFGLIPAHWQLTPLKRRYQVVSGSTPKSDAPHLWDGSILWVTPGDLSRLFGFDISSSMRTITQEGLASCGTTLVPAGSVILSTRAPIGSLGIAATELCTNQGCKALVPRADQHSKFLAYLLSVNADELNVRGRGTTFLELSADELGSFMVPFPPSTEQWAISEFLDRETAKIDALVAEQERLIALLKEKRQAVISHAVTKGLDPSAPMKDSGIEWLGQVPAHWDVGAVKRFLVAKSDAIKTGPFGSQLTATDMQSGPIKVYNQRNVIDGDFDAGNNFITEQKFQELRSFEALPGDLLITTRGTIGRAAILPDGAQRGILHPCLLRVQPDSSRLRTTFLQALVQDSDLLRAQLAYSSNATTIEVIYSNTIASVLVPVPPVTEQDAILQSLSEDLPRLDALTAEVEQALALLQERRSALISAAVTGQIDVRGLVTQQAAA